MGEHTLDLIILPSGSGDLKVEGLTVTSLSWVDHHLDNFVLATGMNLHKVSGPL